MNICGVDLSFNFTGFQLIYVMVANIMWIVSLLFSREYMAHYENKKRYYIFMVATWFATIGVLSSGNFLTTFIFFEIMSFTSYLLVIHEETPGPMRAGETYLAVAVIGGMVMLMGLFLLYDSLGTLQFSELTAAKDAAIKAGSLSKERLYASGLCILFGFGAKAGMVPLHIWLPKAHPVAPAPASALLSGILTKAGIFGAIVISVNLFFEDQAWGLMMVCIGIVTMFLGALLGVFSINLKRTLACSSVSQIGFITLGIGMTVLLGEENALASSGSVIHMINHSMIKLLLFSAAGVVYMNIHKLDLNDIRGYGRKKPYLMILFAIGGLNLAGMPGTSGYISKTLLHESIVEYIEFTEHQFPVFSIFEWVFLVTGGLTFCYMCKLFFCIFVERNNNSELQAKYDAQKNYMNRLSAICLSVPGVVLLCMGILPHMLTDKIAGAAKPFLRGTISEHLVHYFSLTNLKGSFISLGIGVVLYFAIVRVVFIRQNNESSESIYPDLWPKQLDLEDLVYRPLVAILLKPGIFKYIDALPDKFMDVLLHRLLIPMFEFVAQLPDILADFVLMRVFREFTSESKRFSIKGWFDESRIGQKIRTVHNSYLIARDSLSFGLMLAGLGLTLILIYLLLTWR